MPAANCITCWNLPPTHPQSPDTMTVYLLKNGNEIGPLELGEIQALIDSDCISASQPLRLEDGMRSTAGTLPGIRLTKPGAPAVPLGQAPKSAPAPMASLSRDVKSLKRNSAAVTAELNQFMREMRGKSPREMLGAVARSSLARSGFTAAILLATVLFSATVIPFATRDDSNQAQQTRAQQTAEPIAATLPPQPTVPAPSLATNTNQTAALPPSDKQKVADKLGIGETKQGQPSEPNPFETTDDLLQELE